MEATHFESLYPDTSRAREIGEILSFVKEGNSCQMIAFPGVGRANVLGFLSYNKNIREKHLGENQKWFHFVLLNFSEIRKRPLSDAYKFIFLGIIESLRERKMSQEYEAVSKIFKEVANPNDEMVLFQGLKRTIDYLSIEKELTVVFLFDRFEEYIPMVDSSFFANLRVLRNRAKYRFSVVFSLKRPLEDSIEPMIFSDFYEFLTGHNIYLDLTDKPSIDFRISYLEKVSGKKLDEKLKNELLKLTSGHGKLTRLGTETILTIDHLQLTIDKLGEFLLSQKQIQGACFEIWNSLLPEEQREITNYDLPAGKAGLRITNEYLENVGLIKNNAVTIPLFASFLPTMQQSSNATISYDPSTNEIKKGDTTISDQLSSSEFKLLKFLIQNSNRICEKEEIINAVWKDTKTQEGVTDQALDQIVYRLRKKIEENPNIPVHIQTIKGRGLKFTP